MSTWHQRKAGIPVLYHPEKWTVVNDAGLLTVSRFENFKQAEKYAKATGGYLLKPQ